MLPTYYTDADDDDFKNQHFCRTYLLIYFANGQ